MWNRGSYARDMVNIYGDQSFTVQVKAICAFALQICFGMEQVFKECGYEITENISEVRNQLLKNVITEITEEEVEKLLSPFWA